MPSFHHASGNNNGNYWSGIVGILAIQLAVVFAVAVAALAYLNWSSNAALADFMAMDKPSASDLSHPLQSPIPVQQTKSRTACPRRV
jgi:hypothetical protein